MTPAEEKARLASVQLALERLLADGPNTRAGLFGETKSSAAKEFQRRAIRSLENSGIVYKAETGSPPISKVHLKNRKKAEFVLQNPVELSYVVWPKNKPGHEEVEPPPSQPDAFPVPQPAPQEPEVVLTINDDRAPQEQVDTQKGLVEQAPAPVPAASPPRAAVQDQDMQQLMSRLLMVMDAACQSIIYMREKIDALEPKINHLWEQLK